jgi:5-hydroxyisourate hydrolase
VTSLSTHVLDTEAGTAAAGVPVTLLRGAEILAGGVTNPDGRIPDLAGVLAAGAYQLVFDIAAYFDARGRSAPFLQRVTVEFRISPTDAHIHVPLLLAPYACTTYRGT